LEINIPFIANIDESETLFIGVIITLGFVIQFFGITAEEYAFRHNIYKCTDGDCYDDCCDDCDANCKAAHKAAYKTAFKKRDEIIAKLPPGNDYHVERILAQFFMSHNIAIVMFIMFLFTLFYTAYMLLLSLLYTKRFDSTILAVLLGLLFITPFSFYVPYTRYKYSCKVLYAISKSKRLL
jgi:hypothetical protein